MGIGLTWAAGWAPLGAITGWLAGTVIGLPLAVVIPNYAVTFSVVGFVGGTIFSTILTLAEGRRSFGQLSVPRFVALGAFGGLHRGERAPAAREGEVTLPFGAVTRVQIQNIQHDYAHDMCVLRDH